MQGVLWGVATLVLQVLISTSQLERLCAGVLCCRLTSTGVTGSLEGRVVLPSVIGMSACQNSAAYRHFRSRTSLTPALAARGAHARPLQQ